MELLQRAAKRRAALRAPLAHRLRRPAKVIVANHEFKVFKSRDLPAGAQIKDGTNFSQDRKGNWFLNVCVEVEASVARSPVRGVGIDLGLKDFATLSTGEKIDAQRLYLGAEQALAAELRALAATRWWDRSAEDGPRGVAVKEVAA